METKLGDHIDGCDAHTNQLIAGKVIAVIPCGPTQTRYLLDLDTPLTDEHGERTVGVVVHNHQAA